VTYTDWCAITVTKPAPIGRTYVIELSVSPDNLRPLDDLVTGPPQPGRIFAGLRPRGRLIQPNVRAENLDLPCRPCGCLRRPRADQLIAVAPISRPGALIKVSSESRRIFDLRFVGVVGLD
jgi:hypothetical protein